MLDLMGEVCDATKRLGIGALSQVTLLNLERKADTCDAL